MADMFCSGPLRTAYVSQANFKLALFPKFQCYFQGKLEFNRIDLLGAEPKWIIPLTARGFQRKFYLFWISFSL